MLRLIVTVLLLGQGILMAKEEERKCRMGRDYWLYTPDTVDKDKTYWLAVGVHGHRGNGKGAAGLAGWVNKMDNVIVIGPTFPSTDPYYQVLQGKTDKQLLDIFKTLQKEFKLHDKMFIYGFSGGSQFAHRFTMKHPRYVIAASTHSGGTWEKGPSSSSKKVLWTLSCGLKDTAISAGGDQSRIDYFRDFFSRMHRSKSFSYKVFVTDKGHRPDGNVFKNTQECFRVATTGLFDYQRQATDGMSPSEREAWLKKDAKESQALVFNDGKNEYKLDVNKDGWVVSSSVLKELSKTRAMLDKQEKKK